jgi:hypothetical protein
VKTLAALLGFAALGVLFVSVTLGAYLLGMALCAVVLSEVFDG